MNASSHHPSRGSSLRADFVGPDADTATFVENLDPLAAAHSTQDKTAYLSKLRASIIKMQGDINAFLTQKMEAEKQSEGAGAKAVDDLKEERNYGEEAVDEN